MREYEDMRIATGKVEACSQHLKKILLASVFTTLMVPQVVFAQEATEANTEKQVAEETNKRAAALGNALEEIVVTSRRREESLQMVPISVAAMSSSEIEFRNITNLLDLNTTMPNVVIAGSTSQGGERGSFTIRGLGATRNGITDEPRVAVYLDGVFLGSADSSMLDVVNVKRIEVLRGPQGTLFGKNALSGAIHYVSEEPGEEFGGGANFTYGRYNLIEMKAHVDIPLGNDLYTRISGASKKRDGYSRSIITGDEFQDAGRDIVMADVLWRPSSSFDARFVVDYTKIENNGVSLETLDTAPDFPTLPRLVQLFNAFTPNTIDNTLLTDSDYTNRSTSDTYFNQEAWGARLNLNWNISDTLALKSISAYREFTLNRYSDLDGLEYVLFEEEGRRTQESWQQELQLHGNNLDGKLNWVVGGFYFNQELYENKRRYLALDTGVFPANPPDDIVLRKTDSYALFTEGTYQLSDLLSLTAGVRWTSEKIYDFGEQGPDSGENSTTFNKITPRASIAAQWTDDLMTFASFSRGFRSGGHNNAIFPDLPDNGFAPFDPETLDSFEVGLKSDLMDNRVRLNVTAFHQKHKDIQIPQVPPGETENFITNAGDGEINGAEVEVVALLTEGLRINAAVGYLDAKYTRVAPGAEVSLDTPYERAPKWSYSVGAQYDYVVPNVGGILTTRVDWGWQDVQRHNASDDLALTVDSFGLLSARISYEEPDARWRVSAYGTNLTGSRYLLSGLRGGGSTIAVGNYGAPAQWGVTVGVNF